MKNIKSFMKKSLKQYQQNSLKIPKSEGLSEKVCSQELGFPILTGSLPPRLKKHKSRSLGCIESCLSTLFDDPHFECARPSSIQSALLQLVVHGFFPLKTEDFNQGYVHFVIVESKFNINKLHAIVVDLRRASTLIIDPVEFPFSYTSLQEVFEAKKYIFTIIDSTYGDYFPL